MNADRLAANSGPSLLKRLPTAALLALLVFFCFTLSPRHISAATYPLETIELALPVTEGSQPAILYNLIQRYAARHTLVKFTLNYRAGRGGSYAWNYLKDKPGYGYVLAALHYPSFTLLAADKERVFNPDALTPVALFAYAPNALWVAKDSPILSLEDLVIYARDPGNRLIVAGTGSFTDHHMATLIFDRAAGITSLYLPLTGTVESVQAVKDKRATACWGYALDSSTMGGLRPLAVAATERGSALPDIPTFREEKMEVVNGQYFGLAMPSTAKKKVRDAVSDFFLDVLSDQDLLNELNRAGFEPTPLPSMGIAVFAGKQEMEVNLFLKDYTVFPRGRQR